MVAGFKYQDCLCISARGPSFIVERAEGKHLVVDLDLRAPPLVALVPIDSRVLTCSRMMPVLGVLSDRYRSQILAPVVEAIAVDMVHLKAVRETSRVKELYAAGLLRQIWRRGDIPGAAILWEAGNEAEVRAALDSLPINQAGLLEILFLVPLAPYPGFSPAQ